MSPHKNAKPKAAPAETSPAASRALHDVLRAIAFEEGKTVMDLINEGLDHVLAVRNYPPTSELRDKAQTRNSSSALRHKESSE